MVTVAMIAMMKSETRRTLSKVTMSMMTTITTVPHRNLENEWSSLPFFTVQSACIPMFFGLYGVAASLIGLYDCVLIGLCSNGSLQE